jgi:Fe-S-cluster containining protein
MDIELTKALSPVKLILLDTAAKAEKRRVSDRPDIRCKRGCSGCCSRYTRISTAEAVIIYEHLRVKKEWLGVKKRSQDQFDTVQVTDPVAWFKLNIPCPVLGPDKSCLAHSIRPAVCSTHFAASDPELCGPWGVGQGMYESVDFDDLYTKFRERLANAIVGSVSILGLELPIPSGLLLAERISIQSGLDFSQILSLVFRQL